MENLPPLSLSKQKSIRKLRQKKYRKSENAFIGEGFRLFDAASKSPQTAIIDIILSSTLAGCKQAEGVIKEAKKRNIPVFSASDKLVQALSDEVTPSGLIFTIKKLPMTAQDLVATQAAVILYLDRITDPGNMGAIIRSAAWFGVNDVVLSPGCVDPFNSKSVRATAGAVFETRIYPDIGFDWLYRQFKDKKYAFIATVAGDGKSPNQWHIKGKSLIFFGQEASGLSAQILEAADLWLTIPGSGKIESLNLSVAAGVILYEVFNRQIQNK